MAIKLSAASLQLFSRDVHVPRYERRQVEQGIVHMGVGGFHRAHQAVYTEDLFNLGRDLEWGFCGVGVLPQDAAMRAALRSQDCLYTLVERSSAGDSARIIGSIMDYLFAPEQREEVLEKMAAPATKIVSLTITEGGYYRETTTGALDVAHPDIQHDLAHPQQPRCSFGLLLEALERRRQRGHAPITLLSCDNIQNNGDTLKAGLLQFAELRDAKLANWMAQNCGFPNSMVDRITPATTDEHRQLVREQFGIDDAWPVMTETFKQWVIEDRFVHGRPAWETVGAQMTDDVLPYEKMKLRLLNASHQALCYIGILLGDEFVHQTMENDEIRALVQLLMREVTPLLESVPGIDLEEYQATLIERFANPAIRDQLSRIGIYGSSGLPNFVLPSIREHIERGGSYQWLCFTIASWLRYLNGRDENGHEIVMKDPMAPQLQAIARASGADPSPLLAVREIFGDLSQSPEFVRQVRTVLQSFYEHGAQKTLAKALSQAGRVQ